MKRRCLMLVVELYSFYSRIRPEVLSGSLVIVIQGVKKMCPAYTYSDYAHDLEQKMFNKVFKFSPFLCLICLYEGLFCKIGITAVIKTSPYKIK